MAAHILVSKYILGYLSSNKPDIREDLEQRLNKNKNVTILLRLLKTIQNELTKTFESAFHTFIIIIEREVFKLHIVVVKSIETTKKNHSTLTL